MEYSHFKEKYHYDNSTSVMQQYLDIKFAHFECLILFRMGDFYELFFEDAVEASRTLGITLTKRGKCGEKEIPMCGVPFHALENYLNKLIEEGYKIAICEQLETPEAAKKRAGTKAVLHRDVVRIVTPGTVTEESLIIAKVPNYLLSLVCDKNFSAICYIDLSTSEIAVIEVPITETMNELIKLAPKEILLTESSRASRLAESVIKLGFRITYQVDSFFALNKCQKIIIDFYQISSIKAIGEISHIQVSSVGSILEYVSLTQKQNIPKLPFPTLLHFNSFVAIDSSTRRNLEITSNQSGNVKGSIFAVINQTVTKGGSRLLHRFVSSPLTNLKHIEQRLEFVDFFYNHNSLTEILRKILHKTGDLERCLTRILMNKSTPQDLISIKHTLTVSLEIKEHFFNNIGFELPSYIDKLILPTSGNTELYDLINESIRDDAPNTINEGGIIKKSYHHKIAELSNLIDNSRQHIEDLRKKYQEETKIDGIKISHNNVIGLFVDVTPKQNNKIIDPKFIHRQTTITSIRYTTHELQKLESDMVNSRNLLINLELKLYKEVCREVAEKANFLRSLADALNHIDLFCNLAHIAIEYNYTRPILFNDLRFNIENGRHAVVERGLHKRSQSFVNNDCMLGYSEKIWLITGPNMSGKSTFLRQNAVITILAQVGSFVPASKAEIGIVDKIFSRIGSGDDLLKGQSTFMVEMLETSAILAQATEKSLIILDEVGRGTSTYDGVAIAWSVLEFIHNKINCRCLFATHYHELTTIDSLPFMKNYSIAIEEHSGNILFLHQIIAGAADKSYGIHVAQLAGLPRLVIDRANDILIKLESLNEQNNTADLKDCVAIEQNVFTKQTAITANHDAALFDAISNIDPDALTPREAHQALYRLKNILISNLRT
ncbi:MAG: DNA mismatch repair protein MutS [Rickettsiaceae bacterium]|nr:MAG: DNA mismatch repair protein MutS [Rickettsiaceae bacterium]